MITVACVWVNANVAYSADYVLRLRFMAKRGLSIEHRFVCLTDRPEQIPDVETIAIEPPPTSRPGWWSKLELFNPVHGLSGEVLYLDLDVLVVALLMLIVEFEHKGLALIPHAGTFEGRQGLRVVKRYNSSVMRFSFSAETYALYTAWTPGVARTLWGDQDWIGQQYPDQPTMPLEWFPRLSEVAGAKDFPADAKVILCKRPKNHVAAATWPWVKELWQ